ncbi:MAG: glycosyl hydrolase [Armatimonadota bacterium]
MVGTLAFMALALQQMDKLEELRAFHQPVRGMSAQERLQGYELRLRMERESPLSQVLFRNVGPTIQGGRIVDIAVPDGEPAGLLIAFATGGLWRTTNMGTTWEPLFDRESANGIGDIDVSGPNGRLIWVGTGEANSSRTSYAGTGVFKSEDGGGTWQHMGLEETHHIGRVLIHPRNPNTVFVAAIGHLYSWNDERGVYRTKDGGRTWEHVLKVNERTGAIDIAMHPSNPDVLFACMWERDRRAWNFLESGPGSGLYRSDDGGDTWTKVTAGLPDGQYMGRIGVGICRTRPNVMYALIDNQAPRPEAGRDDERVPSGELTLRRLQMLNEEQFLQVPRDVLTRFFRRSLPDLDLDEVLQKMRAGEMKVQHIIDRMRDANATMFEDTIIGAELYRSDDGGRTWRRTHDFRLDSLYNTYGYYFGQVGVDPTNPDKVFLLGVPILMSEDGGKTFRSVGGRGVHVDHHAIWIDPRWPRRIALGNDGGLNLSWDGGNTWQKVNNLPVGQFTTVALDNARPYRIYGGLQDNGTMRGPSTHDPLRNDMWDWETIGGGDGATVQVDLRTNETVFTSSQFGSASARNFLTRESWGITPRSGAGESPLRYNWVTPFLLSSHHPDILYYAANRVFRSLDQGRTWTPISGDLTGEPRQGDVPFGTCTAISESPLQFGLLYVGTDNGRVWRTDDGGVNWREISRGLIPFKWTSRIVASPHDPDTVYVALSGYREDDFAPYLFRSTDRGETWTRISYGLPNEPINVVREDPLVRDLLYVGTDLGVFLSWDAGATWTVMTGNLPHVPVHDLQVHPRDRELVLATHGRSVFVADVSLIQQLTAEVRAKPVHVFPIAPVSRSAMWGYERRSPYAEYNPDRTVRVAFWLSGAGAVRVQIKDSSGAVVRSEDRNGAHGLNFFDVSLMLSPGKPIPPEGLDWKPQTVQEILKDPFEEYRPKYLEAGVYTLEVSSAGQAASARLELRGER